MKGKSRYSLNLNQYRNWFYRLSNDIKKKFKYEVSSSLDFKVVGQVGIEYEYYAPNKRKVDLMNVVSVVDKFFQDAMVERGCIEADDTSVVIQVGCRYAGIDRENPRIEARVFSI